MSIVDKETKSWKDIKDTVYGEKGTERRDELERDFESFKNRTSFTKCARRKKPDPRATWGTSVTAS